jgi:hypothetical protein
MFGTVALLGVGIVLAGCKTAPELTAANAQALIQAKYDAMEATGAGIVVNDLGMRQGATAKLWDRTKVYPNKYWADFTLTADGKKAVKLPGGGDVIQWRPASADDQTYSIVVTAITSNHLKARDVADPTDDVGGTKSAVFNESLNLDGVSNTLQDIAHNPGNKLSSKKTATFALENGAWKLQSIN